MSHRINVVLQDDVWDLLQRIPADERSRTINTALREWTQKRPGFDAAAELGRLWADTLAQPVTTEEIVRWVRSDRDAAH